MDQIKYIYEYEICALILLCIIMIKFFYQKKFPNQKNIIFSWIISISFLDGIMDIVSSINIENALVMPSALVYIGNSIFYILQISLPVLMTIYIASLSRYISNKMLRHNFFVFVPALIAALLLLLNFITNWFFYIDPVKGYIHGKAFNVTYFMTVIYLLMTLLLALLNKKKLKINEFSTICFILCLMFLGMVVQYLYPPLLISGVTIIVSVILMYFTIQKPESMFDSATGAFTYEAMLQFLKDEEEQKEKVQFIAIKINNMHKINELLGIENGSKLLKQVCEFIKSANKKAWTFRMRGNCFVVITKTKKDFIKMQQILEKRMLDVWQVENVSIFVKSIICIFSSSEILKESISPADAVSYLNLAFYENERLNVQKNLIIIGTDLLNRMNRVKLIDSSIRKDLLTGEGFELNFQPLWSIKEKRFTSAEVLLRYKNKELGSISPNEFIPIAENNGMISILDQFVVKKVCQIIKDENIIERYNFKALEVNLSALELNHKSFPEFLKKEIILNNINPNNIVFEITETAATESFETLKECMAEINNIGCFFALDDFGTGYANIARLASLPFKMVKIDKSLLKYSNSLIQDFMRMFKKLNLETVIEGIETEKQLDLVKPTGVDFIQGYYFAKPMDLVELNNFYASLSNSKDEIV